LEVAGGSCRDSRYLHSVGIDAVGSDYDTKTIAYLEERFRGDGFLMKREDAFAFGFEGKSFDTTFSNGFWVLFDDDEKIRSLIREQARITRRYLVALVHNAQNSGLQATFMRGALEDRLYNIRFFEPAELAKLVESAGVRYRSLTIEKFGGRADAFLRERVKGIPNVLRRFGPALSPQLYALQRWKRTERVACVLELE
jgi:hypothetical protein